MEKKKFNVLVIGSGPGGYVAAIRAAQLHKSVALVEARDLGGVCLNRGCIPSKALIANADVLRKIRKAHLYGISVGEFSFNYAEMKKRKDQVVEKIRRSLEGLIKSNKITIINGYAKFDSPHTVKVTGQDACWIESDHIIIATGSESRSLSVCQCDYEIVHDSTSFLDLSKLPKSLIVLGGGVIGCEFASLHQALDVDVTIVELLPTILSTEGKNIADFVTASFKKKGIKIETSASVVKTQLMKNGARLSLADGRELEAEMVLVSVGRKFNTDQLGLEKTGIILENNGAIPTNDHMQTNVPHIYAIGDVTGKWILAHVASHQGIVAANHIGGLPAKMHYQAVPSVIFTDPEIASVGLTLERALAAGYDAKIGSFPFQALGKSQAAIETEGFAQVVIAKNTGQLLGAQVVGYGAATLIAEMTAAIANELTVYSINETIHAHPTTSEAWMEAAFSSIELPIHLPPKK